MEAIYAVDLNDGLSKDGVIPWKSKKDLIFFYNKTKGHVVIMGRNTYFSLPEEVRPLKDRLNIVLTSKYTDKNLLNLQCNASNLIFTEFENIYGGLIRYKTEIVKSHPYLEPDFKIFIIGGKKIYENFIPLCDKVWVTRIKKDYLCDQTFKYDYSEEFNEPEIIEDDDELQISLYTSKKC